MSEKIGEYGNIIVKAWTFIALTSIIPIMMREVLEWGAIVAYIWSGALVVAGIMMAIGYRKSDHRKFNDGIWLAIISGVMISVYIITALN